LNVTFEATPGLYEKETFEISKDPFVAATYSIVEERCSRSKAEILRLEILS
jgi:hypothetical protein